MDNRTRVTFLIGIGLVFAFFAWIGVFGKAHRQEPKRHKVLHASGRFLRPAGQIGEFAIPTPKTDDGDADTYLIYQFYFSGTSDANYYTSFRALPPNGTWITNATLDPSSFISEEEEEELVVDDATNTPEALEGQVSEEAAPDAPADNGEAGTTDAPATDSGSDSGDSGGDGGGGDGGE